MNTVIAAPVPPMVEPGRTTEELVVGAVMVLILVAAAFVIFFVAPRVTAAINVIRACRTDDIQPSTSEPLGDDELTAILDAVQEAIDHPDHFAEWEGECADNRKIQRYAAQLNSTPRRHTS